MNFVSNKKGSRKTSFLYMNNDFISRTSRLDEE